MAERRGDEFMPDRSSPKSIDWSHIVVDPSPFLVWTHYRDALEALCVRLNALLSNSGPGYMANTSKQRSRFNTKVIDIPLQRNGAELLPARLFYIATAHIERDVEIIAPYNNNESKEFEI